MQHYYTIQYMVLVAFRLRCLRSRALKQGLCSAFFSLHHILMPLCPSLFNGFSIRGHECIDIGVINLLVNLREQRVRESPNLTAHSCKYKQNIKHFLSDNKTLIPFYGRSSLPGCNLYERLDNIKRMRCRN